MSKKRDKKKKRIRNETQRLTGKTKVEDYLSAGLLEIFRAGKNIVMRNTATPEEMEEIRKHAKEAIETNSKYIEAAIGRLYKDLISKKEEYVSKFPNKMSEDSQIYAFEKLYSWVFGNTADKSVMAEASIKILAEAIDKFEADVKSRYENYSGFGDIERTVNKAKHALTKVKEMYEDNRNGMNGSFDAEIYVDWLHSSYGEHITTAKDINEEFKLKSK